MAYTPPTRQNLTLNFGGAYAPPSGAYLNIEYSVVTAHIRGATVGYVPSTQFSTPDIRSSIAGYITRVGGLRYPFRLGRPSIEIDGEKLRPVGIAPPELTGPKYVSWRRWVTVSAYPTPRDPRPPRIRFDGGYQGPVGYNLNLNWEIEGAYNAPTGFNLNLEWGKVGYNQARGATLGHTAAYGIPALKQNLVARPVGWENTAAFGEARVVDPTVRVSPYGAPPIGFGESLYVFGGQTSIIPLTIPARTEPPTTVEFDEAREAAFALAPYTTHFGGINASYSHFETWANTGEWRDLNALQNDTHVAPYIPEGFPQAQHARLMAAVYPNGLPDTVVQGDIEVSRVLQGRATIRPVLRNGVPEVYQNSGVPVLEIEFRAAITQVWNPLRPWVGSASIKNEYDYIRPSTIFEGAFTSPHIELLDREVYPRPIPSRMLSDKVQVELEDIYTLPGQPHKAQVVHWKSDIKNNLLSSIVPIGHTLLEVDIPEFLPQRITPAGLATGRIPGNPQLNVIVPQPNRIDLAYSGWESSLIARDGQILHDINRYAYVRTGIHPWGENPQVSQQLRVLTRHQIRVRPYRDNADPTQWPFWKHTVEYYAVNVYPRPITSRAGIGRYSVWRPEDALRAPSIESTLTLGVPLTGHWIQRVRPQGLPPGAFGIPFREGFYEEFVEPPSIYGATYTHTAEGPRASTPPPFLVTYGSRTYEVDIPFRVGEHVNPEYVQALNNRGYFTIHNQPKGGWYTDILPENFPASVKQEFRDSPDPVEYRRGQDVPDGSVRSPWERATLSVVQVGKQNDPLTGQAWDYLPHLRVRAEVALGVVVTLPQRPVFGEIGLAGWGAQVTGAGVPEPAWTQGTPRVSFLKNHLLPDTFNEHVVGAPLITNARRQIWALPLGYGEFIGRHRIRFAVEDASVTVGTYQPTLKQVPSVTVDRVHQYVTSHGWRQTTFSDSHAVWENDNRYVFPRGHYRWGEDQQLGWNVRLAKVDSIHPVWNWGRDPLVIPRPHIQDPLQKAPVPSILSTLAWGDHTVKLAWEWARPRSFNEAVMGEPPVVAGDRFITVGAYAQGRDPTGWANFKPEVWSTLQFIGPTRIPYTQIVMGTPEKARNVYERLTPVSLVTPDLPWRHFVAHHLAPAALHNAQQWGQHVVDYDWPRLKPQPIVTDNWGPRHVLKWDEFIKPKWLESPRSRFGRDTTIDFYSQRVHVSGSIVSLEFTPGPKDEENPSKPPVIHFWEQEIDLHKQVMWGGRRLVGTPWVSGGDRTVYVPSFNKHQIGEHALPPTVTLTPDSWESAEPLSRKHILSLNGRRFITPVHQYRGSVVGDPYIMQPEQYIDLYRHKWGGSVVPWAKVENVQQHIIVGPYKNNGKVTSWPTFGPLVDLGNPVVRFSGLGAPAVSRWHNIRLAARRVTVRMEQDQWAVSEPLVGHWEHKITPQSWDSFTSTKWNVVYVYGFNLPAKGIPSQEDVPVEHSIRNANRTLKFYGPNHEAYGLPFVDFAERMLVHKQPLHANRAGKPIVGLGEHFVRPKGWWDWWDWTQFGLFRVEEKFTVIPLFSFNSKPLDWFGRARIYNRDREITPDIINQPQFSPYAYVESSTRYLVPSTWTSGVFGEKRHTIGTVNRDVIVRQPYPETVIGRHRIYYNQPNLPYTREINLNKLNEQGLPPKNFDPEKDSGDGIPSASRFGHPDLQVNVIDVDGEGIDPGRMGRVSLWTGNIEPRWSYRSVPFGEVIVDRVMRIWPRGIDVKIKVSKNHEVLPKRIFAPFGDARPFGYTPDEAGMMMDAHLNDPINGTSHPWFGAHAVTLQNRTVKPYGFRVWYKYGNPDRWSVPDIWQQDRVIRLKGFRVSRMGVPVIPFALQRIELGYQDFPGLGIGNKVPLFGQTVVSHPEPLVDPVHRVVVEDTYASAHVGQHEVNFFHKQVWVKMPRESTLWGDKTAALHPRYIVADKPMDTLWGTHWVSNQIRSVYPEGWNSCSLEDDNFEDFRFPMRVRRDDGGVQRISPHSLTAPYVMYPRVGDGTQWVDCQGFSEYTSGVAGASPSAHLNASWLIRASGLEHRIEVGRSVIVGLNLGPKGIEPSAPGIATATELCGCGDTAVPVAGRVSSVVTIPAVRYS